MAAVTRSKLGFVLAMAGCAAVSAADAATIAGTVMGPDGKPQSVMLTDDTRLIKVTTIKLDQIKPGSFVATANGADTGVSSELRVFAPPLNGSIVMRSRR